VASSPESSAKIEAAKANGIRFVQLQFTDIIGHVKAVTIPIHRLEEQRQSEAKRRARAEQARLETSVLKLGTIAWSGMVDGVAEIVITGGSASVRSVSGEAPREVKSSFSAPVPKAPMAVDLISSAGRGAISLAQQPAQGNGYTAIVRVDDSAKGGFQRYEFTLRWTLQ
jgi:hypothetical protein